MVQEILHLLLLVRTMMLHGLHCITTAKHHIFACRDLYLTYLLMLCESFNYFSLSLLFVLYLTQEFGVGDVEASHIFSPSCNSHHRPCEPFCLHACMLSWHVHQLACAQMLNGAGMCRAAPCTDCGVLCWWRTA